MNLFSGNVIRDFASWSRNCMCWFLKSKFIFLKKRMISVHVLVIGPPYIFILDLISSWCLSVFGGVWVSYGLRTILLICPIIEFWFFVIRQYDFYCLHNIFPNWRSMFDLMISCHKLLSIVQIQYLCSDFMVTLFEILLAKVQIVVRNKVPSFSKRGRSQSLFL